MKKLQLKPVNFAEALAIILSSQYVKDQATETISPAESLNRVIAQDIKATLDSPISDNSSMDGFCLEASAIEHASSDNPITLPTINGIDAGNIPDSLPKGHCCYIATGGILPDGANAVVKIEDTNSSTDDANITFFKPVKTGSFIRKKSEEYSKGETLIKSGTVATPHVIATIASCGLTAVKVFKKPVVGILTSGNELVMPFEIPKNHQVRNSNSIMLIQQIIEAGATPIDLGIARDDDNSAFTLLSDAAKICDIIVTSGGISMGRQDPFKIAFTELGVEAEIYGVKMKPGKPFFFGHLKNTPIFGLPGNQVSTSVTFELFVRPFIRKALSCANPHRLRLKLPILEKCSNKSGRDFFKRGTIVEQNGESYVSSLASQASHMLSSITGAEILFLHPESKANLEKGEIVDCWVIRN